MTTERLNLLPPGRRRSLRNEYIVRLSVLILVLIIAITLAAAVLLFPSYVFLTSKLRTGESHLKNLISTDSFSDEASLRTRLDLLSSGVTLIAGLDKTASVSPMLRTILAVPHTNIQLNGLNYALNQKTKAYLLTISGNAATRNALQVYQQALQKNPIIKSAELPVSSYAKDSDIPFTITVTFTP